MEVKINIDNWAQLYDSVTIESIVNAHSAGRCRQAENGKQPLPDYSV
jgi:hypothetical protein